VGRGPYEEQLKAQAKELGDKVVFKQGLTDKEIIDEYDNCDVFVMPSEYEAFSIVTLEALSSGKPVIVSNVGFLREISNGNGFTIDSPEDITNAVSFIIDNGFRVDFDRNEYSWDSIAKKTMDVYNSRSKSDN
jgi:glycosyltransferase involved in cell wall biosynthesis